MRPRPPRRKQKGPKFCAAPARRGRDLAEPTQMARDRFSFSAFSGDLIRRGVRPGRAGLANPPWLGAIRSIITSSIYRTCANAKTRSKNSKPDVSHLWKRRSACAAKARQGFATGACAKLGPLASTSDALSSNGRITGAPASRRSIALKWLAASQAAEFRRSSISKSPLNPLALSSLARGLIHSAFELFRRAKRRVERIASSA